MEKLSQINTTDISRTGTVPIKQMKTVIKIAVDFVYVGGEQPVVLLVRCLKQSELYYTLYDTPTQELYDQYQLLSASSKIKPLWLGLTDKIDQLHEKITEWMQNCKCQQMSKTELLELLAICDVELYTTSNLTELVLRQLGFNNRCTIRFLTPYDYHNNSNVFSLQPLSYSNTQHNEISQGLSAIVSSLEKMELKFGKLLFGHPSYEKLMQFVNFKVYHKTEEKK